MATDNEKRFSLEMRGTPFNAWVASADARGVVAGQGVEIIPAIAGKTPHVQGYQLANASGGALTMFIAHTVVAAGVTQIGNTEHVADDGTNDGPEFDSPLAGSSGNNLGMVASGAGNVTGIIWGYYS